MATGSCQTRKSQYFTPAFLQMLNDIGKWSLEKKPDTPEKIKRKRINMGFYSIIIFLSSYGFLAGGYIWKSTIEFSLGYFIAMIFGALFVMRMKTKHMVAAIYPLLLLDILRNGLLPQRGCGVIMIMLHLHCSLFLRYRYLCSLSLEYHTICSVHSPISN